MNAINYIMWGMASVVLVPMAIVVGICLVLLFWPIGIGLLLVYVVHLPMWILFITGALNVIYWGIVA
jgi:hypothetical protein